MKAKQEALDDAISSTTAAIAEGIVPGGGLALLKCIEAISREEATCEGDERTGVQILKRALEAPARQIAENSAVAVGVGQYLPRDAARTPSLRSRCAFNHGGLIRQHTFSHNLCCRASPVPKGRRPIILDGGRYRGHDVFRALALRADVVALGRPLFYGLALVAEQRFSEHLLASACGGLEGSTWTAPRRP